MANSMQFRIQDVKIQNDIYSLAFASLIDHNLLDQSVDDCCPPTPMNQHEISNLYLGALLVICFQSTLVYLLCDFMISDAFCILRGHSIMIVLPRFLSSLMMHINVETDIRAGIGLMKFAINHP